MERRLSRKQLYMLRLEREAIKRAFKALRHRINRHNNNVARRMPPYTYSSVDRGMIMSEQVVWQGGAR